MLTIRPETPADYAELFELHIHAFYKRIGEATLVALLRTRQQYDADLGLVAEKDGQVIGHALFNPMQFYIQGEAVQGLTLSPLAVLPGSSKTGHWRTINGSRASNREAKRL